MADIGSGNGIGSLSLAFHLGQATGRPVVSRQRAPFHLGGARRLVWLGRLTMPTGRAGNLSQISGCSTVERYLPVETCNIVYSGLVG